MTALVVGPDAPLRKTPLLLPPPWGFERPDCEILDDAEPFVRSAHSTAFLWHRPRSGRRWPDGRVTFDLWCGNMIGTSGIVTGYAPEGPLCATCEGRAVGAGWPTAEQVISGAGSRPWPVTRFTPKPYFDPPAVCPGSKRELYRENRDGRTGTCLVCGDHVRLRLIGSRWAPRGFGPVVHPPGDELVRPCRYHAWDHLTLIDAGRVGCQYCET